MLAVFALLSVLTVFYVVLPDGDHEAPTTIYAGPVTRFIATSLLDLEVTRIDLSQVVPADSRRSGALEIVNGDIVVADADGNFFRVNTRTSESPDISRFATRLETNFRSMRKALKKRFPSTTARPGRVSDLLFVARTGELFAAHTFWHEDRQCLASRISSLDKDLLFQSDTDHSSRWQTRFETKSCLPITNASHESGGRIWQTSESKLFLTLGHFARQSPDEYEGVDVGKVVEVDIATGGSRDISRGHRNPQGLTKDSKGRVWSTEHGPKGGDELNLILEGRHYGWPLVSHGTGTGERFLKNSTQHGRHEGFEKPRYAWVPSIGISNLIAVNRFSEHWRDDLLVISLSGNSLHRLRLDGDHVILEERVDLGERLRDIVEETNGTINIWTDKGNILRLRAVDPNASFADKIAKLRPQVREILMQCATCHEVERDESGDSKISLFGIYRAPFAQGPENLYSEAMNGMRNRQIWWDEWQLNKFLTKPESVVPETTMQFDGIEDWSTRQEIVAFLKTLY